MHLESSADLSKAEQELAEAVAVDAVLTGALQDLHLESASVNCRLSTPLEIRRLNLEFAGTDRVTDVLAFPAAEVSPGSDFLLPLSEAQLLGDIVISVATAVHQARATGGQAAAELRLLAVHGLLHLLGYDHGEPDSALRMTVATRGLLNREASRRGEAAPSVPELLPRG